MAARRISSRLLRWFDTARRDLPWRHTSDPWAIWVSEVMLQQTRVEVVAPKFEAFLARFPRPADFAAADDDTLHSAWQGLGYYRRARLLREGARQVVAEHGGEVPGDAEALAALAGIGRYTVGAVGSIAFGLAEPAVDGNVERVVARHAGITDNVRKSATRRVLEAWVRSAIDHQRPGDFNQALMELGATLCTPRAPRCAQCPVAADCVARRDGLTDRLPVLPARKAMVEVSSRSVLCFQTGGRGRAPAAVLGQRVPEGEVNAGQLRLPGPGVLVDCPDGDALAALGWQEHGLRLEVGEPLATVRHGITHHRILHTVHGARLVGRPPRAGFEWAAPDGAAAPWTTIARKAFASLGIDTPEGSRELAARQAGRHPSTEGEG